MVASTGLQISIRLMSLALGLLPTNQGKIVLAVSLVAGRLGTDTITSMCDVTRKDATHNLN